MIDATLLAVALAAVGWFGWRRPFRRGHARWVIRATLAFAGPAVLTLTILGRWDALVRLPVEFQALAGRVARIDAFDLLPAIAAGIPIGGAIVALRIWWARRRGWPLPDSIVAPAPLAARSRAELWPATATALAAGVTEELAFRLAIPLLVARLSGSALAGFAVATVLFVLLHRYQRWPGRIGVAVTALVFVYVYLATGALWLVMLIHAAIDVMALALRPWLARFRS